MSLVWKKFSRCPKRADGAGSVVRSGGWREIEFVGQPRRTRLRDQHQFVLAHKRPVIPVQPRERLRAAWHPARRSDVERQSPVPQRRSGNAVGGAKAAAPADV